jgi:hypothetical protein
MPTGPRSHRSKTSKPTKCGHPSCEKEFHSSKGSDASTLRSGHEGRCRGGKDANEMRSAVHTDCRDWEFIDGPVSVITVVLRIVAIRPSEDVAEIQTLGIELHRKKKTAANTLFRIVLDALINASVNTSDNEALEKYFGYKVSKVTREKAGSKWEPRRCMTIVKAATDHEKGHIDVTLKALLTQPDHLPEPKCPDLILILNLNVGSCLCPNSDGNRGEVFQRPLLCVKLPI